MPASCLDVAYGNAFVEEVGMDMLCFPLYVWQSVCVRYSFLCSCQEKEKGGN